METINQRLARFRKQRQMTMRQIAVAIGIPVSTYRDWEYGTAIQGGAYLKLSEVLQVSLVELLTGEKPKRQEVLNLIAQAEELLAKAKSQLAALI